MARRKVLVLENELLLSAGLRTLLSRQEDLELLSMKFTSQSKMLQTVDSFRPDVIIMDEEELNGIGETVLKAMKAHPKLSVVVALWDDTHIEIYASQRVMIRTLDDFLAVI